MNTINKTDFPNSYKMGPDHKGRFGEYGGRFVSETLMPLILSLEEDYNLAKETKVFGKNIMIFLKIM